MRVKSERSAVLPNFQGINLLPWKKRMLIFGFLIITIIVFAYRVPVRYFANNNDFNVLYLASSALIKGGNPYDHNLLTNIWSHNCGPIADAPKKDLQPSLYPISSYILMYPFALLQIKDAKRLLFGVNCLAIFGLFLVSLKLAKLHYSDWRSIFLFSVFIGLAPIQTAVLFGQFVPIVVLFLLLSIWAYASNFNILSGVFLAIGLCLKPQLGFLFFIYYIISGNFKTYVSCILTSILIFSFGIMKIGLNDFSWLVSWQDNLKYGFEHVNNYSPVNPGRHTLLNLQYPLSTVFESDVLINIIVLIIMVAAFILFIKYRDKSKSSYNILINVSFIATMTLLPCYHRNYDASLLVLPITTSVLLINTQYDKIGKFALILMIPFLAPSATIVLELGQYLGFVSRKSFYLNFFLIPHQVWILLILAGIFIYLMFLEERQGLPSEEIC